MKINRSCSKRKARSTGKEDERTDIYSMDDLVHQRLRVIDQPVRAFQFQESEVRQSAAPVEVCVDKNVFAGAYAALATAYLATLAIASGFGLSVCRSQYKT
ncbi:unnamed protein product [Gongylonema pulchrum]|uniref:Transmembrane protein n=1 Tax=Gongylonema pulchrum TaxID=637853 RepID=A0A183EH98_9BILA|nr:unnamed protein product [Gongylonema pulchrum]